CRAMFLFFFSSRRRHTRFSRDWSSDVCSSDLADGAGGRAVGPTGPGGGVMVMLAGDWAIMQGDARAMLWWLPTDSVDLILTDPPYYRVKGAAWERQCDTPSAYLEWLDTVAEEWQRVLKPNGSLYVFASPRMAARVEVLRSEEQ